MDLQSLGSHLNQKVRLFFDDGVVLDVILLGIDPERDKDLTFEATRILKSNSSLGHKCKRGATLIAQGDTLVNWEIVKD